MTEEETEVALVPLWSMAGGRNPDAGMVMAFARELSKYPKPVADRAIREVCKGREFIPQPFAVSAKCEEILDQMAEEVVAESFQQLKWTEREEEIFYSRDHQEQQELKKAKWCSHWKVDPLEHFHAGMNWRSIARLLPHWAPYETEPDVDEVKLLVGQIVEQGRRRLE